MLQEIEFPTAGLDSVPGAFHLAHLLLSCFPSYWLPINEDYVTGDGEGGIEMTGSMMLIREFCDQFVTPEKATRTRIVSLCVYEQY